MNAARRPVVTLYTRAGCHLCEVAKSILDDVQKERAFELVVLDIDADPALVALYDLEVPVVAIDGRKAFKLRSMTADALRDRLDRAAAPAQA